MHFVSREKSLVTVCWLVAVLFACAESHYSSPLIVAKESVLGADRGIGKIENQIFGQERQYAWEQTTTATSGFRTDTAAARMNLEDSAKKNNHFAARLHAMTSVCPAEFHDYTEVDESLFFVHPQIHPKRHSQIQICKKRGPRSTLCSSVRMQTGPMSLSSQTSADLHNSRVSSNSPVAYSSDSKVVAPPTIRSQALDLAMSHITIQLYTVVTVVSVALSTEYLANSTMKGLLWLFVAP